MTRHDDIVLTGKGLLSPLGEEPAVFAAALRAGAAAFTAIEDFEPPAGYGRAGKVQLTPEVYFPDKNYRVVDRTGQLVLIAAHKTLADAGLDAAWRASHEVGMVLGTTFGSVKTIAGFDRRGIEAGPKYVKPFDFANSVINAAAGQAAIFFDLRGINATVAGGNLSSLLALAQAIEALRMGKGEQLLVGGAEELSFEAILACSRAGLLLEQTEGEQLLPRPFDLRRAGCVLAEGAALCLAETAASARERGARPFARLRGHANTFDPSQGQDAEQGAAAMARAIEAALADAGVGAGDLALVAVGAAGLPKIDRIEAQGLGRGLGEHLATLPILAPKGILGETLGAGGAFQLLAAVDALERGEVAGIPGWAVADTSLPAMRLSAEAQPVQRRIALLTGCGLDGGAAALVVEAL
jgi:3-oxoacyl-[acyl-carrier-protein] synthase II